MSASRDVAIVGMSCAFPHAPDLASFWRVVQSGQSCFSPVPADRWNHAAFYSDNPRDPEKTYARTAGFMDDIRSFAPEFFGIPPRRARQMDPQQRLVLDHARRAIVDAGMAARGMPKSTGVYIGASSCEYRDIAISRLRATQLSGGDMGSPSALTRQQVRAAVERVAPIQAHTMVGVLVNMIACSVSEAFDLCGPSMAMDAACSSALLAVHEAVLHLRNGICDAALAGGVYSICTPDMLVGFSRIGALSRSGICRPFDVAADGFVLGEGVGVVVLKRLEDAQRDGDRIWAVIRGAGLNNDGHGVGPMTPRFEGQLDALGRAYRDAGISPDVACYIEAHGTATPVGDKTEMQAVKENLRLHAEGPVDCAIASAKGNFGHSLAASGMAGLIRGVLALAHRTIPPQAGLCSQRPELELEGTGLRVPEQSAPLTPRSGQPLCIGVNSFGFGGTNVHLVLQEPAPAPSPRTLVAISQPSRQLVVVSAARKDLLALHLDELACAVQASSDSLENIACTLTSTRTREAVQVGFYAKDRIDLVDRLRHAAEIVRGTATPDSTIALVIDGNAHEPETELHRELRRAPLESASLFPGGRPVSLPAPPLPTRAFWVVQPSDAQIEPTENSEDPPAPSQIMPTTNPETISIFQQQLMLLNQQVALLSRQAAAMGLAPLHTPPALSAVAATASMPPAIPAHQAEAATVSVEREHNPTTDSAISAAPLSAEALLPQFLEMVAQIGSFEPSAVNPAQRLGPDLSFDSLMRMDLYLRLTETIPAAKTLPEATLTEDATIAELVEVIAAHLASAVDEGAASAPPVPAHASEAQEFNRYLVTFDDAPALHDTAVLQFPAERVQAGPIVILADSLGVAEALKQRLGDSVQTVVVCGPSADLQQWRDASLIDLTQLDESFSLDAAQATAATLRVLERATTLGRTGNLPAALLLVSSGVNGVALAGVAKALAREWPKTLVRSVELALPLSPASAAEAIYQELFHTHQATEVSYRSGRRQTRHFLHDPARGPELREGAVIAISGGGRGLGAALACELAQRYRARLLLLGRADSATATVAAIEQAGGAALYIPCDVRDPRQVALAFAQCRQLFGPIEHIVHAAGVLQDGPITALQPDRAAEVLEIKMTGAHTLWRSAAGDPLRSFLIFGSLAGCFGNANQAAYSAANHALGRLAAHFAAERDGIRVATLDLPPCENSGMVSRMPAAARELLRRQTAFLTESEALAHILAELSAAGPSGEVVLGKTLDAIASVDRSEWCFSVERQPWLQDHRIEDRILLPFAAVLDHAAAAAGRLGMGPAIQLTSIEMAAPIVVPDVGSTLVVVTACGDLCSATVDIQIQNAGRPAFRATAQPVLEALPLLPRDPARGAPTLSLQHFYQQHTFHGLRMRALQSIDSLHDASATASLQAAGNVPGGMVLDILSIDGMLQLCAYWAVSQLGRIGLPVAAAEFRVLRRPAPGEPLRVAGILNNLEGDLLCADLDLLDEHGQLCAQFRGLKCRLTSRASPARRAPALVERNAPADWQLESLPEMRALQDRLRSAQMAGLKDPYFPLHEGIAGQTSMIRGQEFINFASYNYLGLSGDPDVTAAAIDAVQRYGTSVSASRLASGERPLHVQFEREIADWIGCPAAIAMVGGHATNVSVIGHLFGPQDMVIHDSLAHDSILGGIRLSGAKRLPFPHNDPRALDDILQRVRGSVRRVLIAVEGVYSMDGDIPPLPEIIEIKRRHRAVLLVDEAHSLGVLGRTGRGVGEHWGIDPAGVDIWMGTMSKSLASCGGYLGGSAPLIQYLKYSNPGFVYSVGISPANVAAALAALRKMRAHPELVEQLRGRSRLFLELCRAEGIDTGLSDGTAVVPCIVGNSIQCLRLSEALAQRRINVQPILFPAVEDRLSRLRFFINSGHTEAQIHQTVHILGEELRRLQGSASPQQVARA